MLYLLRYMLLANPCVTLPLLQKQLNIAVGAGKHSSKVEEVHWASGLNLILLLRWAISILSVHLFGTPLCRCLAASSPIPVPAKFSARWSAFFEVRLHPSSTAAPPQLYVDASELVNTPQ